MERGVGRLEVGRERHGDWRLDSGQDWNAEADEEALDFVNYRSAVSIVAGRSGSEGGA
jgi:hypothetical protein